MTILQEELIAGGYTEDTPAAIVYKASWPDERVFRCSVGTLHKTAVDNGIGNLALLCIGGFLGNDYELSKLYDSGFSTGYRDAKSKEIIKISLISFSEFFSGLLQFNPGISIKSYLLYYYHL